MSLRPLIALALLAPLASADLTVGQPGDGADFTDLGAALAAAAVDETVFVLPGTYEAGDTIAQGVNLVGAGSDATFLVAPSTGGASARHLTVRDLPADEQVRVVGVALTGDAGATPGFGAGVELSNNEGSVTLADVVYAPSTADAGLTADGVEALLDVDACLQVILDKVRFDAGGLEDESADGAYGLNAEFALVFANDSDFTSGGKLGPDGRPGVRLATAELWLTSTRITAADGEIVVSDDPGAVAPRGGAGIAAVLGSRIEFFGGLGQPIRGGDGGGVIDSGGTPQIPGAGGPGVLLADGTFAVLASGSSLQGGSSPLGVQAPPSSTDGSSSLLFFLEPQVGLTCSDTLVEPGDTITLEAGGLSNTFLGVFYSTDTSAPVFIPPFGGLVQILPQAPAPVVPIFLGFNGSGQASIPVPASLPPGFRAYFQAVGSPNTIAPSISMPTFIQVGL